MTISNLLEATTELKARAEKNLQTKKNLFTQIKTKLSSLCTTKIQ